MDSKLSAKIATEKKLLKHMISLYCKKNHKEQVLCNQCQDLLSYAEHKADACPRIATKTFCSGCPHPCYHPEKRRAIKAVMRFSGPRLIFYAPLKTLEHALQSLKLRFQKRQSK